MTTGSGTEVWPTGTALLVLAQIVRPDTLLPLEVQIKMSDFPLECDVHEISFVIAHLFSK